MGGKRRCTLSLFFLAAAKKAEFVKENFVSITSNIMQRIITEKKGYNSLCYLVLALANLATNNDGVGKQRRDKQENLMYMCSNSVSHKPENCHLHCRSLFKSRFVG